MTKPAQGMSKISLQHFADDGSADGTPAPGNAEDQLKAAYGAGADGGKPEAKPAAAGKDASGGTVPEGELKLAAWTEQLPPEMRTADAGAKIAKFQKVGDMAKAYLELVEKDAAGGIPGKNATAEELAEFWGKAGKPKTSEEYAFAKDKDNNGAAFAEAAFKANLTAAQAEALYKNMNEQGNAILQARQQEIAQGEKELTKSLVAEYGGKYNEKIEYLVRGLKAAGPNVANLLRQAGLHYNPEITKAFITFGELTSESSFAKGGSAGESLKSIEDGASLYND